MRVSVFLLLLTLPAIAQKVTPSPSLPAPVEVRGPVGSLVTLPEVAGATWFLGSEDKVGFWPDGATCRVSSNLPGRVLVIASGATQVRYVVIFDGPNPMPPGPVTPPVVPPVVPPTPPPLVDPLDAKLRAAFALDAGGKKSDVLKLAALYRNAAPLCKSPTIRTPQQLLDAIRAAGPTMPDPLPATALPATRKAFSAELSAAIGNDLKVQLTDASREKLADLFTRAEKVLEEIGK